ncbi:MAG: tetratricopeptide repeat protein, partial [Bacteroidota bacterium]
MKTLQKAYLTFALLFMTTLLSFGQKGVEDGSRYGHGEDSIRCLRNYSLYREYVKNDGYDDAIPFWRVVYSECP